MVADVVVAATPIAALTEEAVQTAFALRLMTESQVVRVSERRMAAGLPLTERERTTALRLSDEFDAVAADWWSEPPVRVRDLLDEISSGSLRVVLVFLVASAAERIPDDEAAVWEIESILDSLDVGGLFANDRFFSAGSRGRWRNGEGIRIAALREAKQLS
ncbi:hypothetical protein SAMN04487783_1853 [Agrococcus baldri]|uniref:Uncharacterized protein n=1 Tax=Agrococcus baldri TaxID=153730 RepID=A0AA94HNZ6_9MICO|nr:hypothetical protein [Agrococcus baldri]SFS14484.1 hypothetical protein SAMN04487783_1853 [Agrococcus baldri]